MKESGSDQWTEKELLVSISKGNQAAWQVLYKRHTTYAINLASRFVRSRAEAEEITQDAWLALHHHLRNHGEVKEFKPYFAATIVNRCRKVSRDQHENVSLDANLLACLEMSETHWVSSEDDLLKKMEQEELANLLKWNMNKLSDIESKALKLRYFGDYSYAEIARVLDKTEGHARLIAYRALNMLRKEIEGGGIKSCNELRRIGLYRGMSSNGFAFVVPGLIWLMRVVVLERRGQ